MGWTLRITLTLGALLLCTCRYQPEIGDSPFLCDSAEEEPCPNRYHCVEGICRPEHGWPPPDTGTDGNIDGDIDGGTDADVDGDTDTDGATDADIDGAGDPDSSLEVDGNATDLGDQDGAG